MQDYNKAMESVVRKVKAAKTSFGLGLRLAQKKYRNDLYALYAFCREVDDIADDSPSFGIAQNGLKEWRERIEKLFNDEQINNDICIALYPAIKDKRLNKQDLLDVIDGMEMDSVAIVAPNMKTLDDYCDKVASAVGRSFTRILGNSDDDSIKTAYHLGRAFQLTNILRDIYEDAQRGRLYLPRELLEKHELISKNEQIIDIQKIIFHKNLASVCKEISDIAEKHYEKSGTNELSVKLMKNYYKNILNQLRKKNWKDITRRESLSWLTKTKLLVTSSLS